jgi:HD-like signal output (HDOD) protein
MIMPNAAATQRPVSIDALRKRIRRLDNIPTLPAILFPLLRYLEQPIESIQVQKISDLISHDKALTAQCLHLANSPLYGHFRRIESIRGAVMTLGIARVRDIAASCCILKLLPSQSIIDPLVFWEHSLGCALVSRRLARRIGFRECDEAYLTGLLHDIGIIAMLLIMPDEFRRVAELATAQRIPLVEVERQVIGITHNVAGELLAEEWGMSSRVMEVVRRHHEPISEVLYPGLVSLVNLTDLLCRSCGLGYGYEEMQAVNFAAEPGWAILGNECPALRTFGWERFARELGDYVKEVKRLVSVLFRAR